MRNSRSASCSVEFRRAWQLVLGVAALLIATVSCAPFVPSTVSYVDHPKRCQFDFTDWLGATIGVYCHVPGSASQDSPVLIVVPGARRNAEEYLEHWVSLAEENKFVVAAIGADAVRFPTEYDYNAGGVLTSGGELQSEEAWLFSAIDPIFLELKSRLGLNQQHYSLYGHSAGGGFVHRFMLFKPHALVYRAAAANPAFVTLPNQDIPYPFGLSGTRVSNDQVDRWFMAPLTILLGDQDLGPRTKPLSNSGEARKQGPNVFSRGQLLYREAQALAEQKNTPFTWKLHVVEEVGHDSSLMTPHAIRFLFDNRDSDRASE